VDVGTESELEIVKTSVSRMIKNCLESVQDLDIRGWNEIRFWLRSHERYSPSTRPFRKYYVQLEKYSKIWTQLILFCWRTFERDDTGVEFLKEQKRSLALLRDVVCLQNHEDEEVDTAVLDFSINLIKHSDFQREHSIIKYFAGIKGYKLSELRWRRPAEYISILAALQFCMCIIGLEHALPL